jgi:FkbM family methyltransferase
MNLFNAIMHASDVGFRVYMRIYGWFRPDVLATTVFGARVRCVRTDFIQRRIAFFGLYEPNLTYFMASVLRPGDVFVDVGANIGYFTLLAACRVGARGKVCAVEACPATYDLLRANLDLNGITNATAINMAVMDRNCHIRMRTVDRRNIGANAVEVIARPEPGSVAGHPLRDVVGPDLDRARLVKIDVEGAERLILPALLDRFARTDNPAIIVSEIAQENADLIALAKSKGFAVRALRNNYTIGHLLLRAYLRRTDEGGFFVIRDADAYLPGQYDYVFSRPASAPPAAKRRDDRALADIAVPA